MSDHPFSRELLAHIVDDGRDLLRAADTGWSRPVPHCPGWNAADLVGHMGGILAWIATVVTTGERVSRRDREAPPGNRSDLTSWYSNHLQRTADVLATVDPESSVWTFSTLGEHRAGWWRRRLAVEIAIHRWDAQYSAGLDGNPPPQPLDATVAAAGVQEFLTEFLPGLLATRPAQGPAGSLHLHATDVTCEWWVDLDAGPQARAVAGHIKADTAIRGVCSDLLLWLTNREPSRSLEKLGRPDTAELWRQLRR